jgi:hypothetical protein
MNFFHIIREDRNEVKMTLKNARIADQINATLHEQNQAGQSGHSPGSGHCPDHEDDKFKGRKCICDDVHLFKECPYIVTSARKPE